MSADREVVWSELPTPVEFIVALCEVSLDVWREAALEAIRNPASARLAYEVDQGMSSIDPLELWNLFDDVEVALHRFYSAYGIGIGVKSSELDQIRIATRRAIALVASRPTAASEHLDILVGPFLMVTRPLHRRTGDTRRS